MGEVARNSLKGYTYQQYIFALLLAKMDTERRILKIESEAIIKENFDDLYVLEDKVYRFQVKNYPGTTIDDIGVKNNIVTIKTNKNSYNPEESNIMIINTDQLKTDTEFMGFRAVKVEDIIIIPLTPSEVENILDEMFRTESRELQIIQFAYKQIISANFVVEIEDLPTLVRLSVDLEQNTILIREPLNQISKGILCIIGKPGIGKSHYVNELVEKYNNAIVYRFWTGSQDERIIKRLTFETFIGDLALGVFKTPRNFTVEELIQEMQYQCRPIIIDGLDHVENYNLGELDLYLEFLNSLNDIPVVILSRPLKTEITWETFELQNWNSDESALYLAMAHGIASYGITKDIFSVADGYPIITYFLAKHFQMNGEINISFQLEDLNQYYDTLLKDVKMRSLLSFFATSNSFFLESEMAHILQKKILIDVVNDFINLYPYLFRQVLNRISLIHDSLNTYLRKQLDKDQDLQQRVIDVVQESLLSGNIQYMARISSFSFSDEFHKQLIKKYASRSTFFELLKSTIDFNSITMFYRQLQKLLEIHKDVLDIYEYYSFSLIYQMANRNDLIGHNELIYQILIYLNSHLNVEKNIFSSGVMWNVFVLLKSGDDTLYKKYLNDIMYDSNEINSLYESFNEELDFFKKRKKRPNKRNLLKKMKSEKIYEFDKQDILIRYMINVWVNHITEDNYYDILDKYLRDNKEEAVLTLKGIIIQYGIKVMWAKRILEKASYQINELGELGENNIFRNKTLECVIKDSASEGSFGVCNVANSYIRLANYEKRDIDIISINFAWIMHYEHKDYSVYALDIALRVYERHQLIDEMQSISIIRSAMQQSDKGIRHLLYSYINGREAEFTKTLIDKNMFDDDYFPVDIFDLSPDRINYFDVNHIDKRIVELVSYSYRSKCCSYGEIRNILKSKYCKRLLDTLSCYDFEILGPILDKDIEQMITRNDIKILEKDEEIEREYIPFENGFIHENDKTYIIENNIGYVEISKYADGWSSSLPFVELYLIFDQKEIRKNYLEIIHNSMFARVSDREYISAWYLLIGNIPLFLEQTGVAIDWNKMFEIFQWFLQKSLIYDYK